MPIQRALKFCNLCYQYNKQGNIKERDFATSQAMQATEELKSHSLSGPNAGLILIACGDCDYEEPRIAKLLHSPAKEAETLLKKYRS